MDELVFKIKELKAIQPEREWVQALKSEILSQKDSREERLSMDFGFLKNRVFFIVPSALTILLIGVFFYTKNVLNPEIASIDIETLAGISSSLRTVETEIVRTTNSLEGITEAKKALEMGEKVLLALKSGEKVVEATRKIMESVDKSGVAEKSPEVFTTISGVKHSADTLGYTVQEGEQTVLEAQKKLAKSLIEELEGRSLSEGQKSLLAEAKNDYNNGLFGDALAKVIEVSQSQ